MFFRIRDLEVRAGRFDVEIPPGQLEYFAPDLNQDGVLAAQGKVELVSVTLGEIRVTGHLSVSMATECDRCLEPARYTIESDFELFYRPVEAGPGEGGHGAEHAIDDAEAQIGFYEGEGLELSDVLREQVSLSLPMQRLCKPDCQGICPQCGENRNLKNCECQRSPVDDRWAALKQLQN